MPYAIHIHNSQKCIPVAIPDLTKTIDAILRKENLRSADLSVVIVTDRKIHEINKKFLGHDYPTDVVTFDLSEGELSRTRRFKTSRLEGEIYVSAVTARRNAGHFKNSPEQELLLYIVHGILHLLGYDDHSAKDRKAMREKEKEILRKAMTNVK